LSATIERCEVLVGDKKSFWTRGEKKGGDGSGLKTGEGCKGRGGTEKEVGEVRAYVLLIIKGG